MPNSPAAQMDVTNTGLLASALGGIPARDRRHTPAGLIAGTCPHIPGREDEMVWHAAADACGAERLHFAWSAAEGRVWFLAVPSTHLASHPNTWCGLAAVLPGAQRSRPDANLYIDLEDGLATLLAHHPSGAEIYQGDINLITAKAESIARRIGRGGAPAPITRLETMNRLPRVPWRSMSLMEDRLRRLLTASVAASGFSVTLVAGLVWLGATAISATNSSSLAAIQAETESAVGRLLQTAEGLSRSAISSDIGRLLAVDQSILQFGGTLQRFEIQNGRATWTAIVPAALSAEQIASLGATVRHSEGRQLTIENAR